MNLLLKRAVIVTAPAVLLITSSVVFAALANSGRFEQVTTQKAGSKSLSITQVVNWSGNKVRVEGSEGEGNIVIADGKNMYVYNPKSKAAMAGTQSPAAGSKTILESMAENAEMVKKNARRIGTQRVGGFTCDVYSVEKTMGKEKLTMKLWVNKDPKFPVEVKMESRARGHITTMTIRNVKLGVKHPASMFVLPKGTRIIEHPKMPDPHKGNASPKKK